MPEHQPLDANWTAPRREPPMFNAPAVVLIVIAALVAVHVALAVMGDSWRVWAYYVLALIPVRWTDPTYPMLLGSQYWSLATYMLLHADWMHLLFNSLWLLIFGTPVARYLGSWRFLVLSLIAGVMGGLASLFLHWGEEILVIGASGAVSGLLAAAIPLMYGKRVHGGGRPLSFVEFLASPHALLFTAVWLALTLFSGAAGWTGNSFMAEGGIAWEAHVGGFLGGLFSFYLLARRVARPA